MEMGAARGPLLEGGFLRGGSLYVDVPRLQNISAQQVLSCLSRPFLDEVVVHFGIANPEQNHHVPLLVSPWELFHLSRQLTDLIS